MSDRMDNFEHGNTKLTPEQAVRYWRLRAENAEREVERQRDLMEAADVPATPRGAVGLTDTEREVIAWARKAGVPLMSPPRVPEAAQQMHDEIVRLRQQLRAPVEPDPKARAAAERKYDLEAVITAHRAAVGRRPYWMPLSDMEYDAIAGAVLRSARGAV